MGKILSSVTQRHLLRKEAMAPRRQRVIMGQWLISFGLASLFSVMVLTLQASAQVCGDGIINVGEICDNDDGCCLDCELFRVEGEACDTDDNPSTVEVCNRRGECLSVDDDNDGVLDVNDLCLSTAAGALVNADGCSIADLCPCANDWRNQGDYISCVALAAEDFAAADLLAEGEKDALVSEAAQSSCGEKK